MASKLATVLVLLVLCQICLSIRMRRDTPAETKPTDSSSESSEENLDKIVADLAEKLGPKQNEELKRIVDNVNSAKTDEQHIDAYLKMFEFGANTILDHIKNETTSTYRPVTPTPSPASTTPFIIHD